MHTFALTLLALSNLLFSERVFASDSAVGQAIDFSGLPRDDKIYTKETIIEINGIRYRKVEFQSETFFMQLLGSQSTSDEMKVLCNLPSKSSDPLIRVGTKITERNSLFVEGLRYTCNNNGITANSDVRLGLMSAMAVGFTIDDRKSDRSWLKNKRIIVFPGLGFTADAP